MCSGAALHVQERCRVCKKACRVCRSHTACASSAVRAMPILLMLLARAFSRQGCLAGSFLQLLCCLYLWGQKLKPD